jgi:uncharacterized repeat protein (TIGR01451 family)
VLAGSGESAGHFLYWGVKNMVIRLALIFFLIALTAVPVLASGDKIQDNLRNLASMNIDAFIVSENDKEIVYWIRLGNTGELVLRNITLVDIPPKGLKYKDSQYQLSNDRSPTESFFEGFEVLPEEQSFWIDNVIWELGNLQTSQEKVITLVLEKNGSFKDNAQQNTAQVRYEALNTTLQNSTDKSVWSNHFKTSVIHGLRLCDPENKNNLDCVPQSPNIQVDGLLNIPKGQWDADYIVDVKNTGLVTLNDVILEVSLNGDVNFEEAVPSPLDLPEIAYNEQRKYWNIGSLSPGKASSVLIAVYAINGQLKGNELNRTTFLSYSWKGDDLVTSGKKYPRIS